MRSAVAGAAFVLLVAACSGSEADTGSLDLTSGTPTDETVAALVDAIWLEAFDYQGGTTPSALREVADIALTGFVDDVVLGPTHDDGDSVDQFYTLVVNASEFAPRGEENALHYVVFTAGDLDPDGVAKLFSGKPEVVVFANDIDPDWRPNGGDVLAGRPNADTRLLAAHPQGLLLVRESGLVSVLEDIRGWGPGWQPPLSARSGADARAWLIEVTETGLGICLDYSNLTQARPLMSADAAADLDRGTADDCFSIEENNAFFENHPELLAD